MGLQKIVKEELTIRFAGDSGDGMQLVGKKFADATASLGYDLNTFPDFPSEIRAPEGTLYGVSAFQVRMGKKEITTHGDEIDILFAMNASSLKVNLPGLRDGGIIVVNNNGFDKKNLRLAAYEGNPLEDGSLNAYKLIAIDMEGKIKSSVGDLGLPPKALRKSKNFYALGIAFWLLNEPLESTLNWLEKKFGKNPEILRANSEVLKAGWQYANVSEAFDHQFNIEPKSFDKGFYRNISGNHAVAIGLVAAAERANLPLFLGSYPITPATDILQYISGYKKYGIKHLQAEDEIAGITSAIGASYGGYLSATTTSGPGLSLKTEAMGLAVMTELPLVIVNVMRAGPSTGMPTKPEQSDLLQALFGRHGEAPMPVIAAATPADCFDMTIEAARIALKYMTPVLLLTDGYIAQGTEPWKIPEPDELPDISVSFHTNPETYKPYARNADTLARMWAVPGTEGMEHRIGGLEKVDVTGQVSYDAENHQMMTEIRQRKVDGVAKSIPKCKIDGPENGEILILGWGGTYGAITTAVDRLRGKGITVSHLHLRHLNPLPSDLGEILERFDKVLLPEMNTGQLQWILQAKFMKPITGLHKVQGQPFKAGEIEEKVMSMLKLEEVQS